MAIVPMKKGISEMNQITAPIAALFWVDTEDANETRLAIATRWSVKGAFSLKLGPGMYAVFEPQEGIVSSAAFGKLKDFDHESYYISLLSRIEDQAADQFPCQVPYPGDVLVQLSEAKQALLSEFSRLLAKESARLELGRKWFHGGTHTDQGEECLHRQPTDPNPSPETPY